MKNKYKNKGFTQLELLLVVGVILIMSMVIYSTYNKRQSTSIADKQVTYVQFMVNAIANSLTGINSEDTTNVAANVALIDSFTTTANLVNNQIIPPEMLNADGTIRNLWGGGVSVSGTPLDILNDGIANPLPSFKITLTGVPSFGCTILTTNSDLTNATQQITINGDANVIKAPNTSTVDVALASTLCSAQYNTISFFKNAFKAGYKGVQSSGAPAVLRYKESKYYIGTPGENAITSAGTCGGGSVFDAAQSTCVCPAGTQWMGYSCIAENSALPGETGFCPLGQGWDINNKICVTLTAPAAKIICPPGVTDTTDPRCVNSDFSATPIAPTYAANRMIPQHILRQINTSVTESTGGSINPEDLAAAIPDTNPLSGFNGITALTPQIDATWYNGTGYNPKAAPEQCQLLGNNNAANPMAVTTTNNFEGKEPNILPVARPTYYPTGTVSAPTGTWDGKNCNVCVYGTWDGDRCVTPFIPKTN